MAFLTNLSKEMQESRLKDREREEIERIRIREIMIVIGRIRIDIDNNWRKKESDYDRYVPLDV